MIRTILTTAGLLLVSVFLMSGQPTRADDTEVDLELVLAVDVSRSMDFEELRLQRRGYVDAFRHPEVLKAIQSGFTGRIAVTYFEWAGAEWQSQALPWQLIDGPESAEAFAARLEALEVARWSRTSISEALSYAARLFETSGYTSFRQTIDISGDGPNNDGRPVLEVRDAVLASGITINGLPIIIRPSGFGNSWFDLNELDIYYEDCVIGGPGSFIVTVKDSDEFAAAIRRKLILEVAAAPEPLLRHVAVQTAIPRVDCLVGEKMRQRNWQP